MEVVHRLSLNLGLCAVIVGMAQLTPGPANREDKDNFGLTMENVTAFLSGNPWELLMPSVYIGVPVRNKEHSLPYFLRGIESQDYPSNRIQITFLIDTCIDGSQHIIEQWIDAVREQYHSLDIMYTTAKFDVKKTKLWTSEHYRHMIELRQQLLSGARQSWADFYFSIDADVVLMNRKTLRHLVSTSLNASRYMEDVHTMLPVIAPLLNCTSSEYYSNFWGEISETGYYKRSENYFDIQLRHTTGVFSVPMVHTAFLVNLRLVATAYLDYFQPPEPDDTTSVSELQTPIDDLIVFARSAQRFNVTMYIDNSVELFGYFHSPVETTDFDENSDWYDQWLERDREMFIHLRLQAAIDLGNVTVVLPSEHLSEVANKQLPRRNKMGLDEIYYINLLRRSDRRDMMEYFLDQLGISATHIAAVDGQQLTSDMLEQLGVRQLEGYADPYHKRSLKLGEIGCFLSHYALWQEMVDSGFQRILVLEDDIRFGQGFGRELKDVLFEADTRQPDWDLLYIGRKRMSKDEHRVPGTRKLAYPQYTYWTLGYVLKRSGAEKLLAQMPLRKMVAVDEYLPIMFNRHPQSEWLAQFEPRNLIALSAEPLLVEPQRYIGEKGYVSDTENSHVAYT